MDTAAIVMIVVTGTIGVFSVPIVWILTSHQRKMAAIIHGNHQQQAAAQNDTVLAEIRDLRQLVYQQAINLDSLTAEVQKNGSSQSPPPPLSARLIDERSSL